MPKVYLVGAGPGDPGLITVKGRECIAAADVIVYDYLAAPALLRHARPDAELIYVGKKGGDHTLPQDEINRLLVAKAAGHAVVTRLKGGDPFVFGRGGEEAEVLVDAGIPFEIVPGVTSAVAAPAYAGIPLSHRRLTSTIAFVTGHEEPGKESSGIDWSALATGIGTLVFFMGVKNLPTIVSELVSRGRPPETPVALVRWGTTPEQATVSGTLADIVARVREAGLKAPAIIVVGEVVGSRARASRRATSSRRCPISAPTAWSARPSGSRRRRTPDRSSARSTGCGTTTGSCSPASTASPASSSGSLPAAATHGRSATCGRPPSGRSPPSASGPSA